MTEIIASDKPKITTWHLYRALVGLGLTCALLIVSVYLFTAPVIEGNREAARKAAIYQVLPGAVSSTAYRIVNGNLEVAADPATQGETVFCWL